MAERRIRSVIKTFSWRITATITTTIISYMITGKADLAFQIGAIEFFIKIGIGYAHERIWFKIPYGIIREQPDYQI
ncbi:MAG: hypothetical protein CL521_05170 [Actinobacteria bacterium]|nr:hypothetical protein [Actinomycetota bacterium]